jgi:serine protease inhibitor
MLETLAGKAFQLGNQCRQPRLIALLPAAVKTTSLSIANSIWFDRNFQADPVFLQNQCRPFQGGAFKLDFADSKAKTRSMAGV